MGIRRICLTACLLLAVPALGQEAGKESRRRLDDKMLLAYVPQQDEGFITQADLKALGCEAAKESGMYADIPLSGLRIFQLVSKKDCLVRVNTQIVELRYAKKDVVEHWKDIEAGVAKRAGKCASEAAISTDRPGERSLVAIIPGSGKECGFAYVVQDRGFIYEVNVRGSLAATPEFERLVATKIEALASGKAGAFDRPR